MKYNILLIKIALAAALLLPAALWWGSGQDIKVLVQQFLDLLRSTGPATFFVAMALLPAIGAPLSFFCLTAGGIFAPQLGMPVVILLSLLAIATNIALSHLLARRALRPPAGIPGEAVGLPTPANPVRRRH